MIGTMTGEFEAHDETGLALKILIYYHPLGHRELYTKNGERVIKIGPGRYQYGSYPMVNLTSNDPKAV